MKQVRFSLFFTIALVIVVALSGTNLVTAALSMKMTEQLFAESFTLLNQKMLGQTGENLSEINNQVMEMVNTSRQNSALVQYLSAQPEHESERYRLLGSLNNSYDVLQRTGSFLATTLFLGQNGTMLSLSNYSSQPIPPQALAEHPITRQSIQKSQELLYVFSPTRLADGIEEPVVIAARQLTHVTNAQPFGTIYISIPESRFSDAYQHVVTQGSDVLMLTPNGQIASSNLKSRLGEYDPELLELAKETIDEETGEYHTVNYHGSDQIIISHYLPVYNMYLVNLVNRDHMLGDFYRLQPLVFLICFVAVLLGVAATFFLTRRVSRPLVSLIRQMGKAKDGNFVKVEEIHGTYEVVELQHHYNIMVDEIDHYINRLMLEQKERRKSEIQALQMQINPHFLYNTLASIKYLTWQNDSEAVADMINALITLLRNTIGRIDEEIPLSEEFHNIESYLTINRLRYGEGIHVSYGADEDCMECMLPKMIVQPFIENAYFHAFQHKREGNIRVYFRRRDGDLVVEVIDDGDGISKSRQNTLFDSESKGKHFSGIGINNVNDRLRLIYGEGYGVLISSEEGGGTVVTILMKYNRKVTPSSGEESE